MTPRVGLSHYDSVVTRAFAFVTLTPNCFARAMISILFLDETAWLILGQSQQSDEFLCSTCWTHSAA